MLIPIRCFTCNKVLADKYEWFKSRCEELRKSEEVKKAVEEQKKKYPNFDGFFEGKALDELGLERMCCRRCMLSTVELIDKI